MRQRVFPATTPEMSAPNPARTRPAFTSWAIALEIGVHLRVGGIGIGKRIVLIRGEGELAARHAPEREPGPGAGGGPVAGNGEIEQARGDGVAVEREDASDVGGFEPGLNQSYEKSEAALWSRRRGPLRWSH